MPWIKLGDDYFNTDAMAVIRPVGDGDDQTVIFTTGQSAMDSGFLLDVPTDSVFEAVQSARLMELAGMLPDPDEDGPAEDEPATVQPPPDSVPDR